MIIDESWHFPLNFRHALVCLGLLKLFGTWFYYFQPNFTRTHDEYAYAHAYTHIAHTHEHPWKLHEIFHKNISQEISLAPSLRVGA